MKVNMQELVQEVKAKEAPVIHAVNEGVKKSFNQAGATLLEALSFLAISAIVVLGATSLLSSAFGSSDVNQHLREIISIKTGTKSYLSGQGSYVGATNANLIQAGLIPSTLSISGSTITNSFGGTVTVTGTATAYTIVTTTLTKAACTKMVPALSGFNSIQVGAATAVIVFPYTAAQAATDCAIAATPITLIGN